jgi:plasmid stabilization system protein ParE
LVRILKTLKAEEDLYEIWSYIAADNPAAADGLILDFDAKFRLLAAHPKMGRARPAIMPGIRSFPLATTSSFSSRSAAASKSSGFSTAPVTWKRSSSTPGPKAASCQPKL